MQGRRYGLVDEMMMVNNRRNSNKTGLFGEVDVFLSW